MATDLQYREGLTDTQKKQLVTRLDRINAGSAITDTDKANFNYGLGSSWQSYLSPSVNYNDLGKTPSPTVGTQIQPNTTADSVMAGLNAGQQAQQAQLTAQQQQIQNDLQVYKDIQMLQGVNKAETAYGQATQGLMDLRTKEQEKSQALAEAYKSGGVQEYQKKLDELNQQAAQLSGSYLQGLTNVEGKVMPMRFITGQQAQMQKQYATQASAVALQQQALQGNIENAKSIAKEMVDLEYGDIEAQIANQKEIIDLNYANLTREDKKRADEQKYLLDQQQARIDEEKATKKEIQNVAITLASYGVNPDIVNKVMNSQDMEEAIALAGTNLQSPEAKAKLESIRLDQILTKAQIAKTNYEMEISRKYGGLTPAQYAAMLKEEQKEIAAAKTASEQAEKQGVALQEKIVLLDSVLKNKAIDSVVGPSILTRKPTGFKERVMTGLIPFAGPILQLQGAKDSLTGDADRLIGQTEQFISKEFLDSLIDVKAQGATFGALQKAEQDALTSAASYIGQRRITKGKGDDRQVIGYDMSEKDFIKELTTIKTLTQKAYEKATGKVFGADEAALLDEMFNNSSLINPGQYY